MPNISFDVFFDQDFINVTATRSGAAPKAKPAWKVRSAPKLPPKALPPPDPAAPRPTQRPKINAQRNPPKLDSEAAKKALGLKSPSKVEDVTDNASQASDSPKTTPKKKAPKLAPKA